MKPHPLVYDVLRQLKSPFTGEAIFDQLPDIVYFLKNSRGEYVVVNQTLVDRCGLKEKTELLGRTPSQLFRSPLGECYEAQDRWVLKSARPLVQQLELHLFPTRDVGWCLTSKIPLLRPDGTVAGLVGVSQDLRAPHVDSDDYRQIAAAVNHAQWKLSEPTDVTVLARIAGMSRFQLDRRMRLVFGLTTGQWLVKLRIDHAQRRLTDSDDSITEIALEAGYADASAFARQFKQSTGLTPRQFRQARRE